MLIKTAIVLVSLDLLYRLAKFAIKKKLEKMLNRGPRGEVKAPDQLVQCAQCGTWIQKKEAIRKKGQTYCSQDCSKA